jgi:hypothetical protein
MRCSLSLQRTFACLLSLAVTACSVADSNISQHARTSLVGLSELQLESCLGVPDQHSTFGPTDLLTWDSTSSSGDGISFTLPVIGGGVSLSGGGYCHLTARVEYGVTRIIRYSGQTSAIGSPDSYCAPIVRSCLSSLRAGNTPTPVPTQSPTPPQPAATTDRSESVGTAKRGS